MIDVSLSDNGQYLSVNLTDDWMNDDLRDIVFSSRGFYKTEHVSRLLIETTHWLEHTYDMESILTVAEILARLGENAWKVAIVIESLNKQSEALENMMLLKGIALRHFNQTELAEQWLVNG